MFYPGEDHILKVSEIRDYDVILSDEDGGEIRLPKNQKPHDVEVGEFLNVFVYQNSEGNLVATTREPKIKLGEFGYLEVRQVSEFGAFLDWGLDKDVFVPFSEQAQKMVEGRKYVIYLYKDIKSNRLAGSSKLNKFLNNDSLRISAWRRSRNYYCKGL